MPTDAAAAILCSAKVSVLISAPLSALGRSPVQESWPLCLYTTVCSLYQSTRSHSLRLLGGRECLRRARHEEGRPAITQETEYKVTSNRSNPFGSVVRGAPPNQPHRRASVWVGKHALMGGRESDSPTERNNIHEQRPKIHRHVLVAHKRSKGPHLRPACAYAPQGLRVTYGRNPCVG